MSSSVIADALRTVNRKSSPGSPYFHFGLSKGSFIDKHAEEIVKLVQFRMQKYCSMDPSEFSQLSPRDLVENYLADVVKVHVKCEPTPIAKIEEGRPRIIMVESIASEVVQKLIFGPQMKAEIASWQTCPSKPGFGMATDDQAAELFASIGDEKNLYDSDVSGFDWNMARWMFDLSMRAHLENNGVQPGCIYWNACLNALHVLSNSVYLTSSGELFELEVEGVMNSGAAITSWFNSLTRAVIGVLVGHKVIITMGDDAVHDYIENAIEKYRVYGMRLKNFTACREDTFNFCSADIYANKAVPTGVMKATTNLLYKPYDETELADFLRVMRHSPRLDEICDVLVEIEYVSRAALGRIRSSSC